MHSPHDTRTRPRATLCSYSRRARWFAVSARVARLGGRGSSKILGGGRFFRLMPPGVFGPFAWRNPTTTGRGPAPFASARARAARARLRATPRGGRSDAAWVIATNSECTIEFCSSREARSRRRAERCLSTPRVVRFPAAARRTRRFVPPLSSPIGTLCRHGVVDRPPSLGGRGAFHLRPYLSGTS